MNVRQKRVLVIGVCLFLAATMFPPWRPRVADSPYAGAASILKYRPAWVTPYFIPKGERYKVYLTVDLKLLAIEWLAIAVLTPLAMFLLRTRKRPASNSPQAAP